MRGKITILFIVAVLCLSLTGIAAAPDPGEPDGCWEPCGTKVAQCDQDSTFALEKFCTAQIVQSDHGTYYIDLTPYDDVISEGDVRITWYHTNYAPNTKVGIDGSGDAGDEIVDRIESPVARYFDINDNGVFDIYDPVYFDLDGYGWISSGDIRVTASPALDVYNENGELVYEAGEFGEKWTVVALGDGDECYWAECLGDKNGLEEVIGYVDSDCDGEWSCADKLYLYQPHDFDEIEPSVTVENGDEEFDEHHFDAYVTIGDVRLYIPQDDECLEECGTKVLQGDFDATYALKMLPKGAGRIGTFDEFEVYLDMEAEGELGYGQVSIGDIRLSSVSNTYDPNTKVIWCDEKDLGHELEFGNQTIIKYFDFDENGGYSLEDPVYIDLDDDEHVSGGDIRLVQTPVVDTDAHQAGEIGSEWSVVVAGPSVVDDDDAGWLLESLPNEFGKPAEVRELLGYIDSDRSLDWTCVDKLYLQQMVNLNNVEIDGPETAHGLPHNMFVTIGDIRIYVPQEAIDEEGWYDCGTKVMPCDIDTTSVLYWWPTMPGLDIDIGFFDKNHNDEFDVGEAAYVDMDGSGDVTIGDIRLTEVVCKDTTYPPNTKVLDQHAEDREIPLNYGCGFGYLFFVDLNDNDVYDVTDPLYIETDMIQCDAFPFFEDIGPSPGDIRLTQVPVIDNAFGPAGSIGEAYTQIQVGDRDLSWQFFKNADPQGISIINPVEWYISILDMDCSGDWTCNDVLYLKQINNWKDHLHGSVVTPGDLRLFVPPEYIGDVDEPEPPVCSYNQYDANEDCEIDIDELSAAIDDFYAGTLDIDDLSEVIDYFYLGGAGYC